MTIPALSLASNPSIQISMREAIVEELIELAGVPDTQEEELTTEFLKMVQPPEHFHDPRMMTGEDRRLLLFWYWLNTRKRAELVLVYDCDHCGKPHSYVPDVKEVADGYRTISGACYREIEFCGKQARVRPLNGEQLEYLEAMRAAMSQHPPDGREALIAAAKIRLKKLCFHVDIPTVSPERHRDEREKKIELFIRSQPETALVDLAEKVGAKLAEMKHGLDCYVDSEGRILLNMPPHQCPNGGKEALTAPQYRFRADDYIPGI